MQLIEQMGIFPSRYEREKRPALRSVIHTVIASIRMRFVPLPLARLLRRPAKSSKIENFNNHGRSARI